MKKIFAISANKIQLILSCIIVLQLQAYDETFSSLVQEVYDNYHTASGDWCDELWQQVERVVARRGREVSYLELQEEGIDSDYLDVMAIEYCKKHNDTYIATVWPTMNYSSEEMVYNILKEHCTHVAYHKKFVLKNNGPKALIQSIPEKVPHISKDFHCYFTPGKERYPMMCFVIRAKDIKDTVAAKKQLRNIVKLDPYCMHMNDTHNQCLELAYKFLNTNSLHYLNNHKPKEFLNFNQLIPLYVKFIQQHKISLEDICVDGSCILSMYGIRDSAMDFDFLCTKIGNFGNILPLDHHNGAWEKLGFSINDIIYNPKNFFYYNNFKCSSIRSLRDFKLKQAREKDLRDVAVMDEFLSGS